MLRRVVSHPLFYIVLLGGCVALFFSARTASGQGWLGVWTSQKQKNTPNIVYQQKSFVDNSVIGVTMLHLELTQGGGASTVSFQQAVSALQKADNILANNVVTYLQNASNKRVALQTYVRNIDKIIAESDQAMSSLALERESASQEYQTCASEKTAADNQFFQGLGTIDGGLLQQGYNDALKSGTCEASSRIKTNAYQAIISRVEGYRAALQQISTLLSENEDLIVANVDLFRDDYLERLIQIRDQLDIVTRTSALD